MDLKFGTSGLRGLAEDLLAGAGARYARAFGAYLIEAGHADEGAAVLIGRDLRESSPALARAVSSGLKAAGLRPVDCGAVPTPALAGSAMERGAAAVMVTGSHIPADRNGLKFYRPDGEIDKDDEKAIAALAGDDAAIPDTSAPPRPGDNEAVLDWYRRRYRGLLAPDALAGCRIGLYEQSSVARDILGDILADCGATVVPLGRSDRFVAVDTEAIDGDTVARLRGWAQEHLLDRLVSTDGDGDRPLVADETGTPIRGDALGLLSALSLGADCVVTPVTSNSGIDERRGFRVVRTRVGSPYVIAGMQDAAGHKRVVGFEANGGLMTASPIERNGVRLSALPTRDAALPILCVLERMAVAGKPLSVLVDDLALPVALSDRLQDYPQADAARLIERLATRAGAEKFVAGLGTVSAVDTIDGVRIVFDDGATIHFRASGNAPEMRCYAQAASRERAEALLSAGLKRLEHGTFAPEES